MSRAVAFTRGALIAGAPSLLALADGAWVPRGIPSGWPIALALIALAGWMSSAASLPRSPRTALVLMWTGWLAGGLLAAPLLMRSPPLSLAVLLAAIGASVTMRRPATPMGLSQHSSEVLAWTARGAAMNSTIIWLLVAAGIGVPSGRVTVAIGATALLATICVARWVLVAGAAHSSRRAILLATGLVIAGVLPFLVGRWGSFFAVIAIMPAVAIFVLPIGRPAPDDEIDWLELLFSHPPRLLVFTFGLLCLAGTVALSLPFSSASGKPIAYVDALFTAVSAVCVTGLIVLDTPVAFSPAGQAILALLIQLGALGIMTFSTAAFGLLGRRLSLQHEGAVAGLISGTGQGQLFGAAKRVLIVTGVSEGLGAALLSALFWAEGDSLLAALGRGVFTAISAFCNAGFALQSDSLIPYARNSAVLGTVGVLIVLGGVSPFMILRLHHIFLGQYARAQEKVVLATTGTLLFIGALLFAAFEWNSTLSSLSTVDKLWNALFQSITLRTAGFNSVDFGQLTAPTTAFMLLWMFIGGSPGSAAGGIKTTTAGVLVLAVLATVRGRAVAVAFHRRIPHSTVYRATAIVVAGATAVFVGYLAIVLTQNMPSGLALFEVVSALGTVGLSLGGTARLDDLGKLVIAVCMFAGRLGPLTLFMFLARKSAQEPWTRPQEEIQVG